MYEYNPKTDTYTFPVTGYGTRKPGRYCGKIIVSHKDMIAAGEDIRKTQIFTFNNLKLFQYPRAKRVMNVLEDWFNAIEEGTANNRMPNPNGKMFDEEICDKLIKEIEEQTTYEVYFNNTYHAKVGMATEGVVMDAPSGFDRLEGQARQAFAQDIYDILVEVYIAPRSEHTIDRADVGD